GGPAVGGAVGRDERDRERAGAGPASGPAGDGAAYPLRRPARAGQLRRPAAGRPRAGGRAQRDDPGRRSRRGHPERRGPGLAPGAGVTRVFVAGPSAGARLALRARLEGPGLEVVGEGLGLEAAPVRTDVVVLDGARGLARPAATAAVEERLPAAGAAGAHRP